MVLKEVILTVSALGGCCGLERQTCRAAYKYVGVLDRCGGIQHMGYVQTEGESSHPPERIDFNSVYFGEAVVVLKELILTVSTWGRKQWS